MAPPHTQRASVKCQSCRTRKVKCTPVDRNWQAGDICDQCKKSNSTCGPNVGPPTRTVTTPASPWGQVPPLTESVPRPPTRSTYTQSLTSSTSPPGQIPQLLPRQRAQQSSHLLSLPRTLASSSSFSNFAASQPGFQGTSFNPEHPLLPKSTVPLRPEAEDADFEPADDVPVATAFFVHQPSLVDKKSLIEEKFRTLFGLLELSKQFNHERQVIAIETIGLPPSHSEHYSSSLCFATYIDAFAKSLSAFHRDLRLFGPSLPDVGSNLRRESEAISSFLGTMSIDGKIDRAICIQNATNLNQIATNLNQIATMGREVKQNLVQIALDEGNQAEANHLQQSLAKGDREASRQLVDSLDATSARRKSTFDKVNVPSSIQSHPDFGLDNDLYPPLHIALNYRIESVTSLLQPTTLQLGRKDRSNRNPIHVAAATQNVSFLRKIDFSIHQNRLRLRDRDLRGHTPLMVAIRHCDFNCFLVLWQTGERQDRRDSMGNTLLIIACFVGNLEIVKYLLSGGESKHDRDFRGSRGALLTAVAQNHPKVVKLLLEHDPSNPCSPQEINEAARLAHKLGYTNILSLLNPHIQ